MPAWARLAWLNRERLLAAARKLHWSLRTWATLAAFAALGGALYWAYTSGHLYTPGTWPRIQWVLLVVNVVGFVALFLLTSSWGRANDEARDEIDQLRSQIDDLRVAVHEHEHDVEFELDDDEMPEPKGPSTVNAIPSAQPAVPPSERLTETFAAVRAAPVGEREPETVERVLGGRTFRFRGEVG